MSSNATTDAREIITVEKTEDSVCVTHDPPNEDHMADTWPLNEAEAKHLYAELGRVLHDSPR